MQFRELYVLSADGTEVTNLGAAFPTATESTSPGRDLFPPMPGWSPDSKWIAYVAKINHQAESIVISNPDGSDRGDVIRLPRQVCNLSWSRDGSKLRFTAPRDSEFRGFHGNHAIYEMEADGSNLRKIPEVLSGYRLVWSQDESRIAVSVIGLGYRGRRMLASLDKELIYTISADGSDKRVVAKQGHNGPESARPQ